MNDIVNEAQRRTIRRYAHELYPHAEEGEVRPLAVEVPHLYARAQGFEIDGTGWHDMLDLAMARTGELILSGLIALLADALLQGLTGQDAWEWAVNRCAGDTISEWIWERGTFYGVDLARIKPYPCGPEPQTHWHMASTGNALGQGVITYIDCPESECPDCTEPIEHESEQS